MTTTGQTEATAPAVLIDAARLLWQTLPPTVGWQGRAACVGQGWMLADDPGDDARRLCARCPVATACLADALDTPAGQDRGVRAGSSPDQREVWRHRLQQAGVLQQPGVVVRTRVDWDRCRAALVGHGRRRSGGGGHEQPGSEQAQVDRDRLLSDALAQGRLEAGRWRRVARQLDEHAVAGATDGLVALDGVAVEVLWRARSGGRVDLLARLVAQGAPA